MQLGASLSTHYPRAHRVEFGEAVIRKEEMDSQLLVMCLELPRGPSKRDIHIFEEQRTLGFYEHFITASGPPEAWPWCVKTNWYTEKEDRESRYKHSNDGVKCWQTTLTDWILDRMLSCNRRSLYHSFSSKTHQTLACIRVTWRSCQIQIPEPPPQGFWYSGCGMRPETPHLTTHSQGCWCYHPRGPHFKKCWFKPFFVHCLRKGIHNGNLRNNSEVRILNLRLWGK